MKKEETTSVKDLQPNVITNAIIEQEEEESVINDISIEENLEEILKKVQLTYNFKKSKTYLSLSKRGFRNVLVWEIRCF